MTKKTLFGNYVLKCEKSKKIISFNCFLNIFCVKVGKGGIRKNLHIKTGRWETMVYPPVRGDYP